MNENYEYIFLTQHSSLTKMNPATKCTIQQNLNNPKQYIIAYLTILWHAAMQLTNCAEHHAKHLQFCSPLYILEWQKCACKFCLASGLLRLCGGKTSVDDSFCVYKWINYMVDTTEQTCMINTWMFKHRHVSACLDKQGIQCQEHYAADVEGRRTVAVCPEN